MMMMVMMQKSITLEHFHGQINFEIDKYIEGWRMYYIWIKDCFNKKPWKIWILPYCLFAKGLITLYLRPGTSPDSM